jgi:hypothetical protein
MENYSGLSLREEPKSGIFFQAIRHIQNVGCQDAVQNLVIFFCGGRAPFFLPQKNQKNQKSSSARGGPTEKLGQIEGERVAFNQ